MNQEEFVGTIASIGIFVGFGECKGISREINTDFPESCIKTKVSLCIYVSSPLSALCVIRATPTNISAMHPVRRG